MSIGDGVVFTKPWVVNLMLDASGYDSVQDLTKVSILEPSCGDGAFLIPIVERLCHSMSTYGHTPDEAENAIRAYDLDAGKVDFCRQKIASILAKYGWNEGDVHRILASWIKCGDFLTIDVERSFDYVVGNPPYIKSSNLDTQTRELYISKLSTFTLGTDIFVGFIEKGLKLLNSRGKLCYICADRWMQNSYGKKLRKFILDGYHMDLICRMHGVDAFEEKVDAYPAIILINGSDRDTVFVDCSPTFSAIDAHILSEMIIANSIVAGSTFDVCNLPSFDPTGGPWLIAKPEFLNLVNKINSTFPNIEDTGVKIGIGVATGRDDVFVTDKEGVVECERQLPLLCNKDIVGKQPPTNPKHWLINPWDDDGNLVNLSHYPELASYFESNRASLESRHIAKKDRHQWYRTIDKVKCGLQAEPKLLFSDLSVRSDPILDAGQYYPHHNLYWLTSDTWDLKVLGGLLLSDQVESVIDSFGVKMRGKTMRFQAQYLRLIHLPNPTDIERNDSNDLIKAFDIRDRVLASEAFNSILEGKSNA